jgi:hypothetical protein
VWHARCSAAEAGRGWQKQESNKTQEYRVKKLLTASTILVLSVMVWLVGCATSQPNDEERIKGLLSSSDYTDDEHASNYGSSDSTLAEGGDGPGTDGYERIPFVRFRRYVPPGGLTRTVNVTIPAYPGWDDTTALATITVDINGELRTAFDTTVNPILVWRKPFEDQSTRKVFLTKDENGWHIRKVSPMQLATQNAPYTLNVTRILAIGRVSGDTFDLTTADTLLAKDELPCFVPHDTVVVTVTVASDQDSCWAFLHRGRAARPHVWRQPYFRTSTWTFERTWVLGDESYDRPAVRPSIHDAIGWGSLWSDTTAPYVASAWGIPYVVKHPTEPLPNDE